MKRRSAFALAALLLGACSAGARTQLLVEVDSDLHAPDDIDRITVTGQAPDGRVQTAFAELGPGHVPLPRTLAMVHASGALGPFELTIRGTRRDQLVVERRASVFFRAGETLVLRILLPRACIGETCGGDAALTCALGGCRSVEVGPGELEPWDGRLPPLDAAAFDACATPEHCNGRDDDCDGVVDEGFDLLTDPLHCGACGKRCDAAHTSFTCVEGACAVESCEAPWADCDGDGTNGCETDTSSSAMHCGSCETSCRNPSRDCCGGTCGRC